MFKDKSFDVKCLWSQKIYFVYLLTNNDKWLIFARGNFLGDTGFGELYIIGT